MDNEDRNYISDISEWLSYGSINFFGMELSGKDTQAEIFAETFGGVVLGGGDILRNSIIPDHVKEALKRGEYIPTKDYVDIVLPYLSKQEYQQRPLMLSAVGRWIGEEESVMAATKSANHEIKAVVYINIDRQTALRRLSLAQRGRSDDYEEHVIKRISEFVRKTLPVIEVYKKLGLLIEVDGDQSISDVTDDILKKLAEKIKDTPIDEANQAPQYN